MNPGGATIMDTYFEYNGKVYSTPNLPKKLKRMHLSKNDIKIIPKIEATIKKVAEEEKDNEVKKYYFRNKYNGFILTSIYPDLRNINNKEQWEKI